MFARISLLLAITLVGIAAAQTPLASRSLKFEPSGDWQIPALGYAPNSWSILRVTNNTDSAALLQVDVFCGAGHRLPLSSPVSVEPGKTRDVRIEAPTSVPVLCWVRVTEISGKGALGLHLRAFLEALNGNQLEDFERDLGFETSNPAWAIPELQIAGQQLYILNASETPTMFTFCASDEPESKACQRKGANPVRRHANAREAVVVNVEKFSKKYLIAQSSRPGRTIIEVFNDQPGHRRVYTSESTISFGDSDN